MRTFLLFSLLLSASVLVFSQSTSDDFDGYALRAQLRQANDPNAVASVAAPFAMGYVMGIAEGMDDLAWCLPDKVRQGELIDVVDKYLSDHPQELHESRSKITKIALMDAYPCAAGQQKWHLVENLPPAKSKDGLQVLGEVPLPK